MLYVLINQILSCFENGSVDWCLLKSAKTELAVLGQNEGPTPFSTNQHLCLHQLPSELYKTS